MLAKLLEHVSRVRDLQRSWLRSWWFRQRPLRAVPPGDAFEEITLLPFGAKRDGIAREEEQMNHCHAFIGFIEHASSDRRANAFLGGYSYSLEPIVGHSAGMPDRTVSI